MSASTGHLWRILREGTPLAVAYYSTRGVRDALCEELELLVPEGTAFRVEHSPEAAFEHPDAVVALRVDDEREALLLLNRLREKLQPRTMPAVLFLLQDGEAERTLRDLPSLASWLRGREYDPERSEA